MRQNLADSCGTFNAYHQADEHHAPAIRIDPHGESRVQSSVQLLLYRREIQFSDAQ